MFLTLHSYAGLSQMHARVFYTRTHIKARGITMYYSLWVKRLSFKVTPTNHPLYYVIVLPGNINRITHYISHWKTVKICTNFSSILQYIQNINNAVITFFSNNITLKGSVHLIYGKIYTNF